MNPRPAAAVFVYVAAFEFVLVNYLFRSEARIERARAALRAEVDKEAEDGIVAQHTLGGGGKTAAATVAAVRVDVGPAAAAVAFRARLARRVGKIDRLLLSRDGRSMWLNDQKVEIFFRAAFPLAFGLAVLVLFSEVW